MNLLETTVHHVRYGRGRVLSCADGLITIAFESAGEKQFVYPDAFERFLRAEDPAAVAQIAEAIILKKAEEAHREQEAHQQALAAAAAAAVKKPTHGKSAKKRK